MFGYSKKWKLPRVVHTFIIRYRVLLCIIGVLLLIILLFIIVKSIPPTNFERGIIVRIQKDMTVSETANLLQSKHLIRSPFIYKVYVKILHDGKGVQAGSYLFGEPQSSLRIAFRTAYGVDDLQKVKITIPEGTNSKEIGALIKKAIPTFDVSDFVTDARKTEGYLFPETYFFNPDVEPKEVIVAMHDEFNRKIGYIMDEIATSTHTFQDILVMASILEEEANNAKDRALISGVLWNRIRMGMPLQVDAPFYYLFGKGSSQLTINDLATTSKYNTYKNSGLPPAPISNPGIGAIMAALHPTETKYLFYLADRNGVTHYAVTHEEHVANKVKYLQ